MKQDAFNFSQRLDPMIAPCLSPPERVRLSRQCAAILKRLQQGSATNRELSGIALKYTGRISELKQMGYRIDVVERNRVTGLVRYALKGE